MYSYNPYYAEYLSHHGIQGQRWGVRRYQNPDGSLTAAGRKRYNLPFYGDGTGKERTLFYGTRKRALIKESMKNSKDSGLSRSERKKNAKEYANKKLAEKYGDSNKTYKKIDTAVNVLDKIDTAVNAAAATIAIGSVATLAIAAKSQGVKLSDVGFDPHAISKTVLKTAGKTAVAGVALNQAKKAAVKLEDRHYDKSK